MVHSLCGFMLVIWLLASCTHAQTQTLAFPSAEGFGRFAQGGRGGRVIQVTNLNTSGTGSLRACLEATGPRTCIFRVGGIINFPCQSCITIPPYLTIAGQTAPGDGIMLKGWELGFTSTHDIITRHLRVRPGKDEPGPESAGAIECLHSHDIIHDHYSTGWATDDTAGCADYYNVTYQWGIVSEGLGYPGDGSKVGGAGPQRSLITETDKGLSLLHNFWANYDYRVPSISNGHAQVVNNVIYNTHNGAFLNPGYGTGSDLYLYTEFVNNYYFRGPQSQVNTNEPLIVSIGCGWPGSDCGQDAGSKVYLSGNFHNIVRPNNSLPEDAIYACAGQCVPLVTTPFGFPTIPTQVSAQQARIDVLARAGATVPRRDSIDTRAVDSMINNSGGQFNTHTEDSYGGYPTYNSGTPYTDTDGDGMSDAWEIAHGLNPNNPADGPLMAANGYTNLENFLNELAGDNIPGSLRLPQPTNLRAISQAQ